MSQLDLNNPPPGHAYKVAVEREETTAERNVRLGKDIIVFLVAVALVITIAIICVVTLSSPSASAEEKKWAMSILSALAAGLVGYLVRK